VKQKKSLAQVFLRSQKYIGEILSSLDIDGKIVLEIGAGPGDISVALARRARRFFCLEVDPRFCRLLEEKFKPYANAQVIQADIVKFPVSRLGKNIVVFSNAPYQISSKLIKHLIKYRNYLTKAFLTFQKEFAQKLLAKPFEEQYCFLSCYLEYYAKVKKIFEIPKKAFSPQPKVDSTFIEIDFYKKLPLKAKNEELLFKIIQQSFSQPRKKIINSLKLSQSQKDFLPSLKINPSCRPGELKLKDFVVLVDFLVERA